MDPPINGQEFDPAIRSFAAAPADRLLANLESRPEGLSENEAARRGSLFGPNRMPRAKGRPWYFELASDFTHFFALMLWTGAVLALIAGMPQLSVAIIVVIVVNGVFSFWQEYKAERAAEALQALLPHRVTVRRGGSDKVIFAENVVRGDVLVLSEGETIPADARLLTAERLRLDLSSLTGESKPVPRNTSVQTDRGQPVAFFPNLVFAGTSVAGGRGTAVVFAIGAETEFGRIAQLTQAQTKTRSPLEIELERVTRVVTVLAVGLGALFFILGVTFGGLSLPIAAIFAIGIIVANVPEGLLPTLTLSLAFGVRRMARRKALVKRLSAGETLGATTVILTDKTGTLTENEMTVRSFWAGDRTLEMNAHAPDVDREPIIEMFRTAALCCDAHLIPPRTGECKWNAVGDPTEAAILVAATTFGLTESSMRGCERINEVPFDSVRKRMSTIERIDGRPVACVKGALNELLKHCDAVRIGSAHLPLEDSIRDRVRQAHDGFADAGLRVLAVARRDLDPLGDYAGEIDPATIERGLTLLGLLAMEDPPRPEVAGAIRSCRDAGIRVVIVTGDDGLTAAAIGREIGLHTVPPKIFTGRELDRMDDVTLTKILARPDILFARVSPEHKLRLVEACQRIGEVVAVTGDGVNDAPALRRADTGIAMGATGTDVAREAADMVLTDDNFASIVDAVREGRAVYDNIRKFIGYVFGSNAAEMVPFAAFVLFGIPLPLTILQVLAVDVGTDLFPALALGAEPPEPDVMSRPPRRRDEGLLNGPTLVRAYLWLGMIEAGLALGGFFFAQNLAGWTPGAAFVREGPAYLTATTVTFAGIVMAQIGNAFAWRTESQSVFALGFFSNRLLLWCICAEIALMLLLIYVPPFPAIFGMASPSATEWLLIASFGAVLLALEELRKLFNRRRS